MRVGEGEWGVGREWGKYGPKKYFSPGKNHLQDFKAVGISILTFT